MLDETGVDLLRLKYSVMIDSANFLVIIYLVRTQKCPKLSPFPCPYYANVSSYASRTAARTTSTQLGPPT